ncbi:MAG: NUDIX hydrolase [bacterium]|nr:NUDIX hydrolase [bacterium]
METWVNRTCIYEGPIFSVHTGTARLDDDTEAHREIVEHGGGVGVVPVVDGHVILVRQFRIACGRYVIELPAGRLESDEPPEHRAACELEEEVGYRAGRLVHVATCLVSPGFTNQRDYIYLAFDLTRTQQNLETEERIELVHIPLNELDARLTAMEFDDAKTVVGLRELQAYLRANPEVVLLPSPNGRGQGEGSG